MFLCFFQAEDGIRDLVRSRGLGDVYKRQALVLSHTNYRLLVENASEGIVVAQSGRVQFANPMLLSWLGYTWLLYPSDAADERSSVDLGGRRFL